MTLKKLYTVVTLLAVLLPLLGWSAHAVYCERVLQLCRPSADDHAGLAPMSAKSRQLQARAATPHAEG